MNRRAPTFHPGADVGQHVVCGRFSDFERALRTAATDPVACRLTVNAVKLAILSREWSSIRQISHGLATL